MQRSIRFFIGVDEVGRGPLAGPLCVGACLVKARAARVFLRGIKDSKRLSHKERLRWKQILVRAASEESCRLSTALVGERSIDRKGLSRAILIAVCRALRRLGVAPESCRVLLDGGMRAPRTFPFQKTIIGGDESVPLIAAASIIAKVRRDRYMIRLAKQFPQYGFERHKGYGTKEHYEALKKHGISAVHRRSFLKNFLSH